MVRLHFLEQQSARGDRLRNKTLPQEEKLALLSEYSSSFSKQQNFLCVAEEQHHSSSTNIWQIISKGPNEHRPIWYTLALTLFVLSPLPSCSKLALAEILVLWIIWKNLIRLVFSQSFVRPVFFATIHLSSQIFFSPLHALWCMVVSRTAKKLPNMSYC